MPKRLATFLTLSVSAIFVASCTSVDGSEIDRAVCASWLPIYASAADTDQTLRQVYGSNLARAEWCN